MPVRPKKQASRGAAIEILEVDDETSDSEYAISTWANLEARGGTFALTDRMSIHPSLPSPFALSQNSTIVAIHLANPTNENNAIPKVELNILQVLHPVCPLRPQGLSTLSLRI